MSDEQRRDSLADQAAAWIPPWDRPRRPTAEVTESRDESASAEPSVESDLTESRDTSDLVESSGDALDPAEVGETPDSDRPEPVTAAPMTPRDLGSELPLEGPESSKISDEPDAGVGELGGGRGVPRRDGLAGRRRVTTVTQPAPELSDAELRGALEAILLVVDEPVSELVLAQVLEQPAERIGPMLDEIAAGYTAAGHGFELRRAAGGWRLYTRPEYATYVERFVLDGQSVRLTQAALETLAVVAYKQPVTRSRISAIRGVNCDGVIRTLVTRGLVEECGTEPDSGAFLYRTTTLFLEKLGLNTVDELPPLAPFLPDDVEELADATR
ncbi:SMC-Scp complex subunit ScpB [Micromonospora profundi]|uniref:SMC-Scp complex subunit ScpB n=1 Tax=Micromonospora TaxID=1873 RepID=UPI0006AF81B6|nr:SMC-Scp complex subunit ScpB [Micromonospora sp. NRRL B-16802]KOX07682.1 RNA 3-phosphate cyclase [Micromonospora sp. NRRL B-16802]